MVQYIKLFDTKSSNYCFIGQTYLFLTATLLYLYENGPVDGYVMVLDCKGFGLSHVVKSNFYLFKHLIFYLQVITILQYIICRFGLKSLKLSPAVGVCYTKKQIVYQLFIMNISECNSSEAKSHSFFKF